MEKPVESSIRLVVVQCDNRAMTRAALCQLLEGQTKIVVAGEAGTNEDSLQLATQIKPDVILLDSGAYPEKEIKLVKELSTEFASLGKSPRVLVLIAECEESLQTQFVSAGALGMIKQDQSPEILMRAIHCLHKGEIWLERSLAARVMREKFHPRPFDPNDPQKRIALLTERETEVVIFVCEGLKNQAIAQRLFVSEATVRHRLTSIFEKLQIADRLELVIFAYRHGLAEIPR